MIAIYRPSAEPALVDLYLEQTGPSLGFLMNLMGQGRCKGWTLAPAGRPVAAIWLSLIDAEASYWTFASINPHGTGVGRQLSLGSGHRQAWAREPAIWRCVAAMSSPSGCISTAGLSKAGAAATTIDQTREDAIYDPRYGGRGR